MTVVWAIIDYVLFVGVAQAIASALWLLCASGLLATRGRSWFVTHAKRVALFNAALFGWGLVIYSACHAATWGRLYVSHDYVLDWQPFIPFGDWVIQQRFGDGTGRLLPGATMPMLQALWSIAAIATWAGATLTFKRLTRALESAAI